MTKPLRMGTRGSALARTQSLTVAEAVTRATGVPVEMVLIRTEGDQLSTEGRAPQAGDVTGVFTRALDDALREGRIDFAVHSLKDLPTLAVSDLIVVAVPERADSRDALVVAPALSGVSSLEALPERARVATSSPRRVAQLLRLRPDLVTAPLAGNVDTRLTRLAEGVADALLLASAGLDRLGRGAVITRRLDPSELCPAPGQGALALVCRASDFLSVERLRTQDDPASRATAEAERALLNELRGGCRAPVGAHATLRGDELTLFARVLAPDGTESIEGTEHGGVDEADALGRRLAGMLLARGAARLVALAR